MKTTIFYAKVYVRLADSKIYHVYREITNPDSAPKGLKGGAICGGILTWKPSAKYQTDERVVISDTVPQEYQLCKVCEKRVLHLN